MSLMKVRLSQYELLQFWRGHVLCTADDEQLPPDQLHHLLLLVARQSGQDDGVLDKLCIAEEDLSSSLIDISVFDDLW